MFGQRFLVIAFIILAFCQLYAHGAPAKKQPIGPLRPHENPFPPIITVPLADGGIFPFNNPFYPFIGHGPFINGSILSDTDLNYTTTDSTTVPPTTPTAGSATQYATIPLMVLSALPLYYML